MRGIPFDTKAGEFECGMAVWIRENSEDNSIQLERLHRKSRGTYSSPTGDSAASLREKPEGSGDCQKTGGTSIHGIQDLKAGQEQPETCVEVFHLIWAFFKKIITVRSYKLGVCFLQNLIERW